MNQATDRHKSPPVTFRAASESDRRWLAAHAEATGRTVNAVMAEALTALRRRIEARERRATRQQDHT